MSALPTGSDGSSGGETTLVEAGLKGTAPAAFRYSKKERTTDSLKATVAALFFCERSLSHHRSTSSGTTSVGGVVAAAATAISAQVALFAGWRETVANDVLALAMLA
ncbi:MAG: hypothetical protein M3430_17065 [Acidobacteriota bacterium]|nr:hypothetical protein [Acidobacteriota bacterium]